MIAVILAGGENRRMNFPKALLEVGGRKIIERSIVLLKDAFDRVVISTNSPELFFNLGLPMVGDVIDHRGPMTGIYSSLISTSEEAVFVVACDMPFVNEGLVKYIVKLYREQDAVIPLYGGLPQPLLGVYSRAVAPRMESAIFSGRKGLREFLSEIRTHFVEEDDVRLMDPEGKSFININTIQELKKVTGGQSCLV